MARLTVADRATLVRAVELLAEHGRNAALAVSDAVERGELEHWQLEEAVAQLEDA